MNRRAGHWIVRILCSVAVAVGLLAPSAAQATVPPTDPAGPATTAPTEMEEANPFLPENRDLSDCIGLLQRPGCGSEARGGWHQYAVAIAMVGGLLLIFGRVAWGIRKSQKSYSDR